MAIDDDLNACAAIVQKGDPVRFRAAMAAPVSARATLLPIYAFNLEVARAPWVSKEPIIVQMRLQWWRDALDEIATGGLVRGHEVVTPLAAVLSAHSAAMLSDVIEARSIDIEQSPFADQDALFDYLRATGGKLMQAAATALGQPNGELALGFGTVAALASYLVAVPALEIAGKHPLPDGRAEAIVSLAHRGLDWLEVLKRSKKHVPRPARAAYLSAWQAQAILQQAARNPNRVGAGSLALNPIHSSLLLAKMTMLWR